MNTTWKNLERPPEMEGIELSEGDSVKSGDQTFFVGTTPPPLADDDKFEDVIIHDDMNDDMPAVFDPNTIEAFPPRRKTILWERILEQRRKQLTLQQKTPKEQSPQKLRHWT